MALTPQPALVREQGYSYSFMRNCKKQFRSSKGMLTEMVDYEKCKKCECFDPDLGEVKPSSQIVNVCDLCGMTEELWREFAESCEI